MFSDDAECKSLELKCLDSLAVDSSGDQDIVIISRQPIMEWSKEQRLFWSQYVDPNPQFSTSQN